LKRLLEEPESMQEFIGAMVRFSTALTIYGIQQVRHGVNELVTTPMNLERVREAMDSATNSIRSKIDDSQKTTFNSVTTFSEDVLAKTCEKVRENVPDASLLLRNTGDMLRRSASVFNRSAAATADSSEHESAGSASSASASPEAEEAEPVRRAAKRGRRGSGGSGEPQPAADVL
jgi:hypothetical protein